MESGNHFELSRKEIEIHFRSDQNSFLVLEWIGNTIHDEPVFRSDSDSILYVVATRISGLSL
ncbi:hypothetical protein [Leptospira interrogans]|uniref:hypothetical protein n=1 Tax=Leptospira interrogans TaxID=173 RepID=UPI0002C011BA|nr:hypothetical protein LEP1GSC085_2305 [Leptospira interrogans str. L0996]